MLQKVICHFLNNRVTAAWLYSQAVGPNNDSPFGLDNADSTVGSFSTVEGSTWLTSKEDVVLSAHFDSASSHGRVVPSDACQQR